MTQQYQNGFYPGVPGTMLERVTGGGQARSGSETGADNEFVLKHDTVYLIRLTNGSSGQNIVQIRPFWHEEDGA